VTAENTPDTIAPDAKSSQDGEGVQRYKGVLSETSEDKEQKSLERLPGP
jgi:hypothetical protein